MVDATYVLCGESYLWHRLEQRYASTMHFGRRCSILFCGLQVRDFRQSNFSPWVNIATSVRPFVRRDLFHHGRTVVLPPPPLRAAPSFSPLPPPYPFSPSPIRLLCLLLLCLRARLPVALFPTSALLAGGCSLPSHHEHPHAPVRGAPAAPWGCRQPPPTPHGHGRGGGAGAPGAPRHAAAAGRASRGAGAEPGRPPHGGRRGQRR